MGGVGRAGTPLGSDHRVSRGSTAASNLEPHGSVPERAVADNSYHFEDGNVTVQIDQCLFRVHEYKLKEFEELAVMLKEAAGNPGSQKTIHLFTRLEDFRRMLVVLYSSGYDRPKFTTSTLKATLRLSTAYKHPALRSFAIQNLEKRSLAPIDRFALSRDCAVPSWMSTALDDLCEREEPITVKEAQILGFEKFAEIAARREVVKYEWGSKRQLENRSDPLSATEPLVASSESNSVEASTSSPLNNQPEAATQPSQSSPQLASEFERYRQPSRVGRDNGSLPRLLAEQLEFYERTGIDLTDNSYSDFGDL